MSYMSSISRRIGVTASVPGTADSISRAVLNQSLMPSLKKKFAEKHVVITGGSEGIGLALACEFVKANAHVTIIARSKDKLEAASSKLKELAKACNSCSTVNVESTDVTDYAQVQSAVAAAQSKRGAIDVLVCNAGSAVPGYFHEQGVEVFERMMRLNYMGTVNTVKAVYDGMVKRNSGYIVFISSSMGLMGFTGYSAYCPSKYAVRGLAECLRNELQGTGVRVSIAFPPDTKTPGFETENLVKPMETSKISESSEVFTPEAVAKSMAGGMAQGSFFLPCPDFGLVVHATAVKGMIPRRFPWIILEMLLGILSPILHAVYSGMWDGIAKKNAPQRFRKLWNTMNEKSS